MEYKQIIEMLSTFDWNKNSKDIIIEFLDMMLFELKLLRSRELNKDES